MRNHLTRIAIPLSLLLSTSGVAPLSSQQLEAVDDAYQVREDDSPKMVGDVLVNDISPARLLVSGHTAASQGTLVDNGDGTFDYTPDPDFFGDVSFDYTVVAESRLSAPAGIPDYGYAVDADGDLAIVGAPDGTSCAACVPGRAYVYAREGDEWIFEALLRGSDDFDLFGVSVGISGSTAVVGAFNAAPSSRGAAYVFERTGVEWTQTAKLVPTHALDKQWFGQDVAIDGDTIVVGSPEDHPFTKGTGSAYVFVRDGAGWRLQQRLLDPDGASGDRFGRSVDLQGDLVAVGAPYGGPSQFAGAVLLFYRTGEVWGNIASFSSSDTNLLGSDVSVSFPGEVPGVGTTLAIVGGATTGFGGVVTPGDAYVLTYTTAGWAQELYLPGIFRDVAVRGNRLLLGRDDESGPSGMTDVTEIYVRAAGSWHFGTTLTPLTPGCAGCRFSGELAWRDDDTFIVGNPTGRAFVRSLSSSTATVDVEVLSINDAPSFSGGADASSLEDAGPQTETGWATSFSTGPSNESDQTFSFELVANSRPELFSAGPTVDPVTGDLTYTAAADANGTAELTLRARDDGGTDRGGEDASDPHGFEIAVTPVNDAPSFGLLDTSLRRTNVDGAAIQVPGWATGISAGPPNESGQGLAFEIVTANPALFATGPTIDAATGNLQFTPLADVNGETLVTALLRDDGGTDNGGVDGSGEASFTLRVTLPPVAKCADVEVATPADRCEADASIDDGSFDPDGEAVTLLQVPSGPFQVGDTLALLLVSDDEAADECEATVTVEDATAPVADCGAPPSIAAPDVPVSFQATGTDNCGILTVTVENAACWRTTPSGREVRDRSCSLAVAGDALTVDRATGPGGRIEWEAVVLDSFGNETRRQCAVAVAGGSP